MMILPKEDLSIAEQRQEFAQEICQLLNHSGNQTVLPFFCIQILLIMCGKPLLFYYDVF